MDFYYSPASSPCRSVLMTAAALKIKLNLKPINLMKKEHLTPEFLKLNPQHTIPTLVDNDFALWESRAICIYLIEKYGKNDSLYPKDPKTRAIINQRLYFDLGTILKYFYDYFLAPFYGKAQEPETLKKVEESVELLNSFLETGDFVAGTNQMSFADIALFATVSTFEVYDFDFHPYPRVAKWLTLMKETVPGHELNAEGLDILRSYLASKP